MLSGKVRLYDRDTRADVFLPKGMHDPAELLERIRLLLVRKRGPKRAPGTTRPRFAIPGSLSPPLPPTPKASCNINDGMSAFIEAVELRKTYRIGKIEVPALRGITFEVQKGEFVSVVGPRAAANPPSSTFWAA